MIIEELYVNAKEISNIADLKAGDKLVLKKHRIESGAMSSSSFAADAELREHGFVEVKAITGGGKVQTGRNSLLCRRDIVVNFLTVQEELPEAPEVKHAVVPVPDEVRETLANFEGINKGDLVVLEPSEELSTLVKYIHLVDTFSTGKDLLNKVHTSEESVTLEVSSVGDRLIEFFNGDEARIALDKVFGDLFVKGERVEPAPEILLKYEFNTIPDDPDNVEFKILHQSPEITEYLRESKEFEGIKLRSIYFPEYCPEINTLYLKGSEGQVSCTLPKDMVRTIHDALQLLISGVHHAYKIPYVNRVDYLLNRALI